MEQLEDNLGALDIALSPAQIARLDEVSKPQLPFPHEFLKGAWNISQGGTTINGRPSEVWPLAPQTDAERH
jgi:hypothetical protein